MKNAQNKPQPKTARHVRRSARIEFAGGAKFHTMANEFWSYIKRGFVQLVSEKPLVGEVKNETEFRLVLVGHTVFDPKEREHLAEVMNAKKHYKRKKGFS
ncbi:MAG: hypothetical protein ACR2MG_15690 [Pyrinomonadaceae bacterium]